ncbi:hypothetical protein [Pedobacter zeae]|uniref:Uncharacterized protein n=2 Tax=Pedobacter zeae TaxID=1737356 RepID=A0A7W6K7T5_9SPHI|nr:hypothetical protein [Pedobacter zeae]MBB4106754.1 hypothetical protein [Pedobacter zeae]GGH03544.1 hypothetical protein GCM10007422_18660 [Pedobacter zeae]
MLSVILFIACNTVYAQQSGFTYEGFEKEILKFKPQKKNGVAQDKFDYASMILSETKKATKDNPDNFNLADYFNVLFAFLTLNIPDDALDIAYKKFSSAPGSCEYLIAFKDKVNQGKIYDRIRQRYMADLGKCNGIPKAAGLSAQKNDHSAKSPLAKQLEDILQQDQKFRTTGIPNADLASKQKKLDIKNQERIDSLFNVYQTYIGKSMVGEKYQNVMWIVIQHSDLGRMEKYLPVISKAVESKELPELNLKMLIDRIYAIKYKYQIFGSQGGVKLADEKTIQSVRVRYNLK